MLLELCDRILVLCGGRATATIPARFATKELLGMKMTGALSAGKWRMTMSEKATAPFVHVVQRAAIAPGKLVLIRLAAILLALITGGIFLLFLNQNPLVIYRPWSPARWAAHFPAGDG